MVDNAAVLLRCGQGGGLDPWLPSVAFFIIGGTRGEDSKRGPIISRLVLDIGGIRRGDPKGGSKNSRLVLGIGRI